MQQTTGRARAMNRVLILTAVIVSLLPITPALAASGPVAVTILAPKTVAAGTSFTVTGSATLEGAGVPSQSVDIRVGGLPAATVTTDLAGNFSASLSLEVGAHSLVATVFRGRAQLESASDPAAVSVRALGVGPAVQITQAPPAVTVSTAATFSFATEPDVATRCSLDGSYFSACSSPKTYFSLTHGAHTFAVQAVDALGTSGASEFHSWMVDTVAPAVAIGTAPASPSNQNAATFSFTSETGATYACSLDSGAFTSCLSPRSYAGLSNGMHTFAVRATDAVGNTSAAASHTWTVDTFAPDTTITAAPPAVSGSTSATFSFTSSETGSFACSLDGGAFASCVSPASYSGLTGSTHTFSVRASDAAGNTDATPASRTWVIDVTGPQVTITATPASPTNSASASFSFTTEADASAVCSLDGGAYAACTSPRSYSALGDGTRTFSVRARDAAGNLGDATSHSWVIDTVAPAAALHAIPASPTRETSQTMRFSTEPDARLECALDGAAFTTCTSPLTLSGLASGAHTFAVRARDAAGNIDPTPDSVTWTVDTVAVAASIAATPAGPANNNAPVVSGVAETGSVVRAYRSATCAGSPVAQGTTADYASGLTAVVDDDTTNPLTVRVTDGAGNVSPCSSAVTYIEDSTAPAFTGSPRAIGAAMDALMVNWAGATDASAITYEVCASTSLGACAASFTPIASASGTARLARVGGRAARTRYEVVVRATDAAGNRTLSGAAPATTLGGGVAAGVAAGGRHACALIANGTARCWGSNVRGQIGDGTTTQRNGAWVTTGLTDAAALSAGDSHTCAMLQDATARCWGHNLSGQLGDGTTTQRNLPTAVAGITGVTAIAAGGSHTCAVLWDATVRCWGYNDFGQLGDGTTTQRTSPVEVPGVTGAVAISAGTFHTCAVLRDGAVRCWGRNLKGQLGTGSTTDSNVAVVVAGISDAFAITAGGDHTCALLSAGTARCWGDNTYGQLGDATTTDRLAPVRVTDLVDAVAISAGSYHSCASLRDGTVRCWGYNAYGQVGDGTTFPLERTVPAGVTGLTGSVGVSAGAYHSCAALGDGTVRCWGENANAQVGDGSTTGRPSARTVRGLIAISAISAGAYHSCALPTSSVAHCWGWNYSGQIGDGTNTQRLTPAAVVNQFAPTAISAGSFHTCALPGDGTARCWGANGSGELGNGSQTNSSVWVTVSGLSNITAIAGGGSHTCAVTGDRSAYCWGSNSDGQLADGGSGWRTTPFQVNIWDAVAITAGSRHTCALLANATVRCWGDNSSGQLGRSGFLRTAIPLEVSGLTGVVAISAGASHTCALLGDSTVACWGENASGQVGDGSTVRRYAPVAVSGVSGAVAVSAGVEHTCALLVDGTARCWGSNTDGQLGDATTVQRTTPTTVAMLSGAVVIQTGGFHTCALLGNGLSRCWGRNTTGQLGDGTTTSRSWPVDVALFG